MNDAFFLYYGADCWLVSCFVRKFVIDFGGVLYLISGTKVVICLGFIIP